MFVLYVSGSRWCPLELMLGQVIRASGIIKAFVAGVKNELNFDLPDSPNV